MIYQTKLLFRFFAIAIFSAALVTAASAQATRTWVSGVGDDANPCSRTAPCKTFAGSISKTAAGGEINTLDPGGFGTVNITKSITIDATGTLGSILASGVNGVIINGAGITVTLRGLTINGAGTTRGVNGVRILNAKEVHIENCAIFGFSNFGISDERTIGGNLFVSNTTIRSNGTGTTSGGNVGIGLIATSTPEIRAYLDRVELKAGTTGLSVAGANTATITNSQIIGNQTYGVVGSGSITNIMIFNNIISGNNYGVGISAGNPNLGISNNSITRNGTGLYYNTGSNGLILSWKDNKIAGNGTENAPSSNFTVQ